jgi:large subunit ribosomal protein L10
LAITREKKTELLELYKDQIEKSSALVFTDYRGTSVPQIQSLRTKLTETDTTYMVVKNSIMSLALEQSGREQPEEFLTGTKAVAFVGEDIGKGVSALLDWIKAEKIVEINGAMLESSVFDANGAESLADLPTKEQTLAMILGTLSAPASDIVRILNAPAASLVRVLNAYVEKQNEAEATS